VSVTLRLRDKEFEVRAGMTVRSALEQVGVEPESVIPTRQGELITEDEILQDGERIRLVAVISGGRR
jgi:sulfur carrier protein ThiS